MMLELSVTLLSLTCHQSVHTLFLVTISDLHNFLGVMYSLKLIALRTQGMEEEEQNKEKERERNAT